MPAPAADLGGGAAVLTGSLVAALALHIVPVWLVIGALLVVAAAFTAWWLGSGSTIPLALAALFHLAALTVSMHAPWLSAVALFEVVAFSGLVHLRSRSSGLAADAGTVLACAIAGAVWSSGATADTAPSRVVLVGLLVLGVLVLVAPYAPAWCWSCPAPALARTGLEAGAAGSASVLAITRVLLAPARHDATWTATYLTVTGVVVTAMSLLRPDRRPVVGGGLLAASSWVRLWDLGIEAPEAFTLPSAVVLLVFGLAHLHRTPSASTTRALAPGLSLALVSSLASLSRRLVGNRPVVTRLVLALAATMTVVLIVAGGFVFWRVKFALNRQLDQDLKAHPGVVQRAVATGVIPPSDTPGHSYQI